jgi:hypothetical protein
MFLPSFLPSFLRSGRSEICSAHFVSERARERASGCEGKIERAP